LITNKVHHKDLKMLNTSKKQSYFFWS